MSRVAAVGSRGLFGRALHPLRVRNKLDRSLSGPGFLSHDSLGPQSEPNFLDRFPLIRQNVSWE